MTWFRVDDSFYDHPKVIDLIENHKCWKGSITLWTRAGSWCSKHEKDGVVPASVVKSLGGTTQEASALVSCGLWKQLEKGFVFHGWQERNPLKKDLDEKRDQTKKRVSEWREREAEKRKTEQGDKQSRNAVTLSYQSKPVTLPPSQTLPDPDPSQTLPDPNSQRARAAGSAAPALPTVASDRVADNDSDQSALDRAEQLFAESRAFLRREFSRRFEESNPKGGCWTQGGSPDVDTVARWALTVEGGHEAAIRKTLDNFFADPFCRSIHFGVNHLAKLPQKYHAPRERAQAAPESPEALRTEARSAVIAGDVERARRLTARAEELSNASMQNGGRRARA